jgi:hypothetical protein
MSQLEAVKAEATRLYREKKDDEALLISIGRRELALKKKLDIGIEGDPVNATEMMGLDAVKEAGRRVLKLWNGQLYKLVCPAAGASDKEREELLRALNISEVAAIGVVVSLLIPLGVPAPVAAPLAALLVRKFLLPAKDELCKMWGESLAEAE